MHVFEGKKTTFHFNSDLSGEVLIWNNEDEQREANAKVLGSDLIAFFANCVRDKRIGEPEQATDKKILFG